MDGLLQGRIFGGNGVIPGQAQTEGQVGMFAYPDRVHNFIEELDVGHRKLGGQGLQILAERLTQGVIPGEQFILQLQQPAPAIDALKTFVFRVAEQLLFNFYVFGR